jgi:glycosyltransferase involved in cell wall biosynthesis
MPTVSVIIPSYNHERFVKECIQSVLKQTFQDFEIIITDDGSSDRTVEIIENFKDPRIKLFRHIKNKGASVATNNCISNSNGKYIAMLSSDDAWYLEKLEVQVQYLDEHPEIAAVFGKPEWVDESGNPIKEKYFPAMDMFDVGNRTRFEWLNHFFYKGNCLCHPCSLVRKECYAEVGMLNPSFASIPDFDLWVRICLKYEIAILDQKLIQFRWMSNETNASSDTNQNRIRNRFELKQILNHYLRITELDEFLLVFPDLPKHDGLTADVIPFLLAKLAIDTGIDYKILWGLEVIYTTLQNEKSAWALEEKFNFTYRDFIRLAGENDVFRISSRPTLRSVFRIFLSVIKTYLKNAYLLVVRVLSK